MATIIAGVSDTLTTSDLTPYFSSGNSMNSNTIMTPIQLTGPLIS